MNNNNWAIPTYLDILKKQQEEKELNPIDIFVRYNEPAGAVMEIQFREQLQSLIDFVILYTRRN